MLEKWYKKLFENKVLAFDKKFRFEKEIFKKPRPFQKN